MSKRTFAVLIVVATCVLAGTAVVAADNGPDVPTTNNTSTADEAYLSDDGSVVMVSHGDTSADGVGELGMNVTEGLVFGSYQQPVETNVTGAFSMAANQSGINASGSLAMPRPEALESLDLTVDSETTAENSRSDLDLDATVALPEDASQVTMMFDEFTTTGSVTTTASTLETQGSAEWSARPGLDSQEYAFDLRATDEGHVLEARQSYNVSSFAAEQWNTREKATQTLSGQFTMIATMLDGSSNFTMDSYAFESTDDGGHLEVEYTVELRGVHEFLRQGLVESLSQSTATLPTDGDTTENLDVSLDNVSIEHVSVALDVDQGSAEEMGSGTASWNVSVSGYDQLMSAYMAALESSDETGMIANQSEQLESQFAAMRAADYAQTATWDIDVAMADGSVQASVSMEQRTDNWATYVEERDARDLPAIGTQRLAFDAATEGDQLVMNGSTLVQQDETFDQTLESLERSFEQSSSMTTTPTETNPFSRLRAAEFLGSRLDASVNETTVTVDGHAEFGNLSAITEMVETETDVGSIDGMYVDASGETPTTYLRMEDMVESDDPDAATLREHEMITEDTVIYPPGEWDEQSQTVTVEESAVETNMMVPQANDDAQQMGDDAETTTSSADDDTETTTDDESDETTTDNEGVDETTTDSGSDDAETTTDDESDETGESPDESAETTTASGPGFGALLSMVALLAVALIGARRR
ncbi:hypothetical protein HLRTI_000968 [Halorhabdus tiamatea SARL4B]|uniref:PGF-CTERM archaeal protein-sorting signal domain-containing protein n=1 Tax=Halorhabdus tiamatea SARL4B TaxID=1033806 RepID=F7PHQ1_9EURY|nr:PGF-CTERM sorting domain-containing protein [Halorhabdus tiamatea]ERJ06895.1 hypothetical protein HLRTI_000968 [Halorhabdus tiamatea SARL4B]CCQ32401.1 conserved hypothetical protein [Halorhabdus tiamatea SARL4B]